jgi:hypothetical protein
MLGADVVIGAAVLLLIMCWAALDYHLDRRAERLARNRVVRVVTIAPALHGPYRSGGGPPLRIDETDAALRRVERSRRIIKYVLGVPLTLLALVMMVLMLPEALGEIVWGAFKDRRHR